MKIQFYLNEILTDTLKSKGVEGESPHLTAKRLMEDLLKGEVIPSAIAAMPPDTLAEIQERLEKLETLSGDRPNDDLTQISDRLENLESAIAAINGRLNEGCGEFTRMGDRLTHLERILLSEKTAKYYKDRPQTGLTHKEIAEAIGSSERTMQRVAKEKERWPEGYFWSEESKKWFLLEG